MKGRAAPVAGEDSAPKLFSSPWLARRLRSAIGSLGGTQLCVAFSGGADSTALLAATVALRVPHRCAVRAVHVNHHLQSGALAWAREARATARRLGVVCKIVDAPVRVARGASAEAAAREARYAALHAALHEGEWLLLAHHQDDQAETLLLQLLRGAGIAGLAAMPVRSQRTLRPLLNVTRAQLAAFLQRRSLPWIDDPTNADDRFDRNYLRLRVLPVLRLRWPSLAITIGRSAALAAEAQQLLSAQADQQLQNACDGAALRVCALRCLDPAERRNLLRRWLELRGLPMPDQRRLQEIAGPMLRARFDAQPLVRWPGALLRRHGALLHANAESAATPDSAASVEPLNWNWRRESCLRLPGGARLELRPDPHGKLLRAALPARVTVRFRSDVAAPEQRAGGKRLKRLLQAQARLPWQRGVVPLIYSGHRLLAVGDRWLGPVARGVGAEPAFRLYWCAAPA